MGPAKGIAQTAVFAEVRLDNLLLLFLPHPVNGHGRSLRQGTAEADDRLVAHIVINIDQMVFHTLFIRLKNQAFLLG
ncbi:hypothetical protein D3C75_773260 [compost metagenome]